MSRFVSYDLLFTEENGPLNQLAEVTESDSQSLWLENPSKTVQLLPEHHLNEAIALNSHIQVIEHFQGWSLHLPGQPIPMADNPFFPDANLNLLCLRLFPNITWEKGLTPT